MGRTGSGGAGACARVCHTDPHARKRSAGASGSRRCSYLHCGGVWKHVELTVAPQAQGTKPSEKPGVRLHGRARRARLTERPRPRRPPLPASPQAWRWTPPIDGGGRQTGRGCRRRTPSPAPLPREGWFSRPRLPLQRAGATWPTSSRRTRPDSERLRAAAPSPPPPPLTPAEAVCMKVVSQ